MQLKCVVLCDEYCQLSSDLNVYIDLRMALPNPWVQQMINNNFWYFSCSIKKSSSILSSIQLIAHISCDDDKTAFFRILETHVIFLYNYNYTMCSLM